MARCPFAEWRPLGSQTEPRLTKKYGIAGHTMVGSLASTDSYFRQQGYGGPESHFGVGQGHIYQWQDTDWQADAQLEGNDNIVSIETADHGAGYPPWSGSNVPAMTPADLELFIQLCVWICDTHDIPPVLMDDSSEHPSMGIGWHRLGVDPWRAPGTELWSTSYAKICPGDRKIAQIKASIPIIRARLEGQDMPLDATDLAKIENLLTKERGQYPTGNPIAISSPAAHLYSWEARNQARQNGAMLAVLLARDPADVDEAALAAALVALLPQLDTAAILAAIQALPADTVAAIKAAL